IGSGSDHTVFLNHLGIPTVGLAFDGPYGVYHSMYDDHFWMQHFGDPGFKYHRLISEYWGRLALRLADADSSPMDFPYFSKDLKLWISELKKNEDAKRNLDFAGLNKDVDRFV